MLPLLAAATASHPALPPYWMILPFAALLLSIALQFLSTPLTAPVHLPACYFVGEVVRGNRPSEVWDKVTHAPLGVFTGDALFSLYLGAIVLGVAIGLLGYGVLKSFWHMPLKKRPSLGPGRAQP